MLDLLCSERDLALDEVLEQIAAVEGLSDDVVAVFCLVDSFQPEQVAVIDVPEYLHLVDKTVHFVGIIF